MIPSQDDPRLFVSACIVESDTLDNILKEKNIEGVSHICLTINGAELEALEGMDRTLKKNKFSMLIANQEKFRPTVNGIPLNEKITLLLKKYGFSTKIGKRWIVVSQSKNELKKSHNFRNI